MPAKSIADMTPAQIREAAHEAIVREIGYAGFIRYLQDTSLGSGDYTRDRWNWLPRHDSAEDFWKDADAAAAELNRTSEPSPSSGSTA
jgi:hypothetical protein